MRILGFSLISLLWLLFFFWLGTRFPGAFRGVPIVG